MKQEKHKCEKVKMTNMCMIVDSATKKVLVQNRNKNDWDGLSFPGGHIEEGEAIIPSTVREVKEETGLDIENLIPCGFKDWYDFKKKERYIVFFFKTSSYSGTLIEESKEGKNEWLSVDEIKSGKVAEDFIEMLNIFTGESKRKEFFYKDKKEEKENDRWQKEFY